MVGGHHNTRDYYRVTASGELRTIGLSIRLERHTFSISVKNYFY